jgi:drug/metabolite transporter (DMT)-like permease
MSNAISSRATAIGFLAILLWSGLALLTALTKGVPPFELLALSFGVAFAASLIVLAGRGKAGFRSWRQPWPVWASGFAGIFFYHALYFSALKAAPPVEASLIAYLWPLLIVILSTLMAGEPFRILQLVGAMLGLCGTVLVVLGRGGGHAVGSASMAGLTEAAGCAIVWSVYSVNNRRYSDVPTEVMGGICGLVAVAGGASHLLFEQTVMPGPVGWVAIVALGLGPTGLAFFAWDYATKNGRLPLLGALSYCAPLFSTVLLVLCGKAPANPTILLSALLIIGGAVLAGRSGRQDARGQRRVERLVEAADLPPLAGHVEAEAQQPVDHRGNDHADQHADIDPL